MKLVLKWRTTSHQRNSYFLLSGGQVLPDRGTVEIDLLVAETDRRLRVLIAMWELGEGSLEDPRWATFERTYSHGEGYSYIFEFSTPNRMIFLEEGITDQNMKDFGIALLLAAGKGKNLTGGPTLAHFLPED